MKVQIVNGVIAAGLILGGYLWGHATPAVVHAQSFTQPSTKVVTLPKSWGHVVAAEGPVVTLEDANGTVCQYDTRDGSVSFIIQRN